MDVSDTYLERLYVLDLVWFGVGWNVSHEPVVQIQVDFLLIPLHP